ncbi:MAG TPA: hypothetical protein EYP58_04060 [bacterium (Candidatus Stahlbacteria)]|nr:hypothetical protein [Candidatus Stahlbacteria bacterium]
MIGLEWQRDDGRPMKIDLGFYKGPIALLLYLIQKHEIDIMDVPVARVADIYLESLKDMKLDEIGEFLVLATVLIMIKLRAILKKPEEEEEEPITFYQIAEEYHRYRGVIDHLKSRAEVEIRFKPRPGERTQKLPSIDSAILAELLKEIERRKKIDIEIPKAKVNRGEIESMLETKLDEYRYIDLAGLFRELSSIDACVMLFIIILDWVMRQTIAVHQESPMAPVYLRKR